MSYTIRKEIKTLENVCDIIQDNTNAEINNEQASVMRDALVDIEEEFDRCNNDLKETESNVSALESRIEDLEEKQDADVTIDDMYNHEVEITEGTLISSTNLGDTQALQAFADLCYRLKSHTAVINFLNH